MQFSIKNLLSLSIFAGILGCLADVLLLYAPTAQYERMDYQFLLDIPLSRLAWGHYIGILAIPFELPGLLVLAQHFRPSSNRAPYWVGAIITFIMMMGLLYHGAIFFVAHALQHSTAPLLTIEQLRPFFDPLGTALAILFVLLCVLFAAALYRGKTSLPRNLLFFNPLFAYAFCILLYALLPDVGRFFIVAGFNFSITILLISLRCFAPPLS